MNGSFGIPFKPFIENAEPEAEATEVIVTADGKEQSFPIEKAKEFFIGFSKDGKPLSDEEGGPIHIYFGDGSNRENPITKCKIFYIKIIYVRLTQSSYPSMTSPCSTIAHYI